jgi:fructose-1,6-bisphosphatase
MSEDGKFFVSYDPIDGNNVLDVNMSVSSIFGIWQTKDL